MTTWKIFWISYSVVSVEPIQHNIKLEAYDLAKESLQLICDYLSSGRQRAKTGAAYSDWTMSFAEFLKALYWDLCFSIFLLMTFFLSLKSQTFVISQMIPFCIPMTATFPNSEWFWTWYEESSLFSKFQFMILGENNHLETDVLQRIR